MAEIDFLTFSSGHVDTSLIRYGRSNAAEFQAPDGSYVLGFWALQQVQGFSGLLCNVAAVNPTHEQQIGGVSACVRKYTRKSCSPMIFFVNGRDARGSAYIMGLTEENPYRIVIRKGSLVAPLRIGDEANIGESVDSFDGGWHQICLTASANPHGEVSLRGQVNVGTIAVPVWAIIDGLDDLYDDPCGIHTGSPPITGGMFPGMGMYVNGEEGCVGLFDYFQAGYQALPV